MGTTCPLSSERTPDLKFVDRVHYPTLQISFLCGNSRTDNPNQSTERQLTKRRRRSVNLIAEYAEAEGIRATELGNRLDISKGRASELINGKRKCSNDIARRMAKLTGRPWHEYVDT